MAVPTFTLTRGGTTIEVPHPLFGYKTTIDLSLKISRRRDGHNAIYDPGATYDIRSFTGTFQYSATDQLNLEQFFNLTAQGRSQTATMTLDASSGFFPFGPDKGDTGVFTVAVLPPSYQGVGEAPYKYFTSEITFVMVSAPAYSIPADSNADYGDITIGTIANLRFPEGWFSPENILKYAITTTNNPANTKQIDFGQSSDIYDTAVILNCGSVKAPNLLNYLTGTARGASFNVVPPTDSYMFGRYKQGTATYACHLGDRQIAITHNDFNNFDIEFKLNAD